MQHSEDADRPHLETKATQPNVSAVKWPAPDSRKERVRRRIVRPVYVPTPPPKPAGWKHNA